MFFRFSSIHRKSKLLEMRSEIGGVAPLAQASPPSWAMSTGHSPVAMHLGSSPQRRESLWTEQSAAEWTSIILSPELPQRLPALPKSGNWNAEAALQKEKEKGRESFVGSVAPWCLPHCDSSGQHAGWNTLGIPISPLSTGRTTSSAWQLPLAPEFAMRKPTLQLQVEGKRKIYLSGKQVRRQLVWDTRRTHAAHLNLTPSAPSTWEGKHGDAPLFCWWARVFAKHTHRCRQWHHHRRSQTERQLQRKSLA